MNPTFVDRHGVFKQITSVGNITGQSVITNDLTVSNNVIPGGVLTCNEVGLATWKIEPAGFTDASINTDGDLILTDTNGVANNLGSVIGPTGAVGTTVGILLESFYIQGTNQLTTTTSAQTIPGLSKTFTTSLNSIVQITATVYVNSTDNTKSTQGLIYVLVDSVIVDSYYYSTATGSGLTNLPIPVSINYTQKLSPGSHSVAIQVKQWFQEGFVNNVPSAYAGYQGVTDANAMISKLNIMLFSI
jgi:hypothetical protein